VALGGVWEMNKLTPVYTLDQDLLYENLWRRIWLNDIVNQDQTTDNYREIYMKIYAL
jgi:hypothetical protein